MTAAKNIFLNIIKIAVMSVLFYLLFWAAILALFCLGLFGLIAIPILGGGYLTFCVWFARLGKHEPLKKRIISSIPMIVVSVLFGLAAVFPEVIEDFIERRKSGIYYHQADEFIGINGPVEKDGDGLLDTPFQTSTIMIDYDTMRISFVLEGLIDECPTFMLSKDLPEFTDMRLQSVRDLSSPGRVMRTYYSDSHVPHLTSGIEIELESGEIWRAEMDRERLQIENEFPLLPLAVAACDELIEYHDSDLPQNAGNIAHPSLLLDYDDMYAYMVYNQYDYDVFCRDFKLKERDYKSAGVPELEVLARIELSSPWKEVFVYHRENELHNHPHGIALISEDGRLYMGEETVTGISEFKIEESKYACSGNERDILKSLDE